MTVRRRMAKEDFPPSGKLELPKEPVAKVKYEGNVLNHAGAVTGKYTDPNIPNEFEGEVGRGHLIKGLEETLLDMREGENRSVTIPPRLAYGNPPTSFPRPKDVPDSVNLRLDISLEKISYTSLKEQNDK